MENREFDAIFYDLGGTLRLVERDAQFEAEARRKIAEMCGEKGDPDEFCKFLDYRYAGYRKWCFETMKEAPEEELWTKWLTPEYDRELIKKNAIELTIEYRNKDGRRVVAPNGAQSVRDMYANGYKLGIISNLVTSQEIPRWLKEDDLEKYFGAVLLSCVEGIRKPDPRISDKACRLLGVKPERCVYIGDNLNRDVEGTRLAVVFDVREELAFCGKVCISEISLVIQPRAREYIDRVLVGNLESFLADFAHKLINGYIRIGDIHRFLILVTKNRRVLGGHAKQIRTRKLLFRFHVVIGILRVHRQDDFGFLLIGGAIGPSRIIFARVMFALPGEPIRCSSYRKAVVGQCHARSGDERDHER